MKKLQSKVFFGNIVKIGSKQFIYFDNDAAKKFVAVSSNSNSETNSILSKLIELITENRENNNSNKPSILDRLLEKLQLNNENNNSNNTSSNISISSSPGPGYNAHYRNLNSKLQKVYSYIYSQKSALFAGNTVSLTNLKKSLGSLSSSEITKVLNALMNDKPEFYYTCTNNVASLAYTSNITITSNYIKLKRVKSDINRIESIGNSVALQANNQSSTYAKIKYAHDWICNHMTYKKSNISIDAFVTGRGLCQSYAQMFQYIMNKLNIDSIYITSSNDQHTWNHVKVDGTWYMLDACYDDTSGTNNYFLKGKSAEKYSVKNSYMYPSISNYAYR